MPQWKLATPKPGGSLPEGLLNKLAVAVGTVLIAALIISAGFCGGGADDEADNPEAEEGVEDGPAVRPGQPVGPPAPRGDHAPGGATAGRRASRRSSGGASAVGGRCGRGRATRGPGRRSLRRPPARVSRRPHRQLGPVAGSGHDRDSETGGPGGARPANNVQTREPRRLELPGRTATRDHRGGGGHPTATPTAGHPRRFIESGATSPGVSTTACRRAGDPPALVHPTPRLRQPSSPHHSRRSPRLGARLRRLLPGGRARQPARRRVSRTRPGVCLRPPSIPPIASAYSSLAALA